MTHCAKSAINAQSEYAVRMASRLEGEHLGLVEDTILNVNNCGRLQAAGAA